MRRKRNGETDNHDRWLVSYADFITLLFAFFVVLFASTKTDKSHAKAFSESIEKALRNGAASQNLTALLNGIDGKRGVKVAGQPNSNYTKVRTEQPLGPGESEDLSASFDILKNSLKQELEDGSVRLSLEKRGLIIELNAGAFFASGDDAINASAYPAVARLAKILNALSNPLRLEGHTDSQPIRNSHFRSNWELSAARSIAMLRVLNERFDVSVNRMAVVGYGDTGALDTNGTEKGRLRNRRVDIVILNEQGMRSEPAGTAGNLLKSKSDALVAQTEQHANKP